MRRELKLGEASAAESSTYTDFAQINVGGLRTDGSDGVNEVSYLLLDVIEEMRLLQPSSSVQVSKKSPDRFLKRAARIIRTGFGQPSVFNSDLIVQELVRMGKAMADARDGGSSGCVEVGAFGKENYNLTGYFNLPKVLELTLHDGLDPRTGRRLGPETGDPASFESFDRLFDAFCRQLHHFVEVKVRGNNVVERLYAAHMPAPFLSLLIDDCITTGRDYHDGGARYNTTYIQGVGLGTMADALAALKYHVFDRDTLSLPALLAVLEADFEGHERTRQLLLNRTPRYGNDDDYADGVMRQVFEAYFQAVDGRPNTKGGHYHVTPRPTGAGPERPCRRVSRPCRAPTVTGRRPSCARRPRWTTPAPGARCSTRNSRPRSWPATRAWTTWCSWCAPIFASTGTTSSLTSSTPTPCAPPSATRSSTAT